MEIGNISKLKQLTIDGITELWKTSTDGRRVVFKGEGGRENQIYEGKIRVNT